MNDVKSLPPSPLITDDVKPYWEAAARGMLLIRKCNKCGEHYFYPRPFCAFCMSDDTAWVETSGEGIIYSFTLTPKAPFFAIPAMIKLNEGPIMTSAIVECDAGQVAIGQQVSVTFVATAGGQPIPAFRHK